MKKSYLITVNSRSKSTHFLETLERQLPLILAALSNNNSTAKLYSINCSPEELLEILKKEQIVTSDILMDAPFTFEPKNSKGLPVPYINKW